MKRLNLELTDSDFDELVKAKEALHAASIAEAIRRSVRFTNKILELQEDRRQITTTDENGKQTLIVIT